MGDAEDRDAFLYDSFPEGFKFGLATSAYQIEGGWNLDGRGESIWDAFCHDKEKPTNILDGSSGDVACDSYHKYKEDVQLLKNMGAKVYRFSVSWTRILPNGTPSTINQPGIDYYNRLIDELLVHGIEPMVTLFHWDTPSAFNGDWLNEEIVEHFGAYARICFQAFGDRVKTWITLNEPFVYSILAYHHGIFAPGKNAEPAAFPYLSVHNMLKAHAEAYHIYQKEFKEGQKGRVGISVDSWWYHPADPNSKPDLEATERALQFRLGWLAHPIFKGDYPPVMREYLDRKSIAEGRTQSRLPTLDTEWVRKLKGSADFLGLNHYTTQLVTHTPSQEGQSGWEFDSDAVLSQDTSWPTSGSDWLRPVPWGLRRLLSWIKNEYGNPEVLITENGCSTSESEIEDTPRVDYFRTYINEVLKAVRLDGCNVSGYVGWALMDVFEWNRGYLDKFGVHSVDFTSPERTRTPKASARLLTNIFRDNGFLKD